MTKELLSYFFKTIKTFDFFDFFSLLSVVFTFKIHIYLKNCNRKNIYGWMYIAW